MCTFDSDFHSLSAPNPIVVPRHTTPGNPRARAGGRPRRDGAVALHTTDPAAALPGSSTPTGRPDLGCSRICLSFGTRSTFNKINRAWWQNSPSVNAPHEQLCVCPIFTRCFSRAGRSLAPLLARQPLRARDACASRSRLSCPPPFAQVLPVPTEDGPQRHAGAARDDDRRGVHDPDHHQRAEGGHQARQELLPAAVRDPKNLALFLRKCFSSSKKRKRWGRRRL